MDKVTALRATVDWDGMDAVQAKAINRYRAVAGRPAHAFPGLPPTLGEPPHQNSHPHGSLRTPILPR
jgi:hypothetical protein